MNPAFDRNAVLSRAVSYLAQSLPRLAAAQPRLYGPDNRPLAPSVVQYNKRAASRTGSMRNWDPRHLASDQAGIAQRELITRRISDLIASDPHAAGVVNTFPVTVIGNGLTPYPAIDAELLGISEKKASALEAAQRLVFVRWAPHADAAGDMPFGAIQFLWERSLLQFGESFTLVMMDRARSGYQLCLRVIHPLRVKTPVDKRNTGNIIDGIELSDAGAPAAAWIKRAVPHRILSDVSANFIRVPFRIGHRYSLIHDFFHEDPEQMRGVSPLTPALKGFRDLSDFLDAELVSNVVTAAFSLFIEVQAGANPLDVAANAASFYDDTQQPAKIETTRYAEMNPGAVMYGNTGERPHPISANRPGATFQPFVREIKKAFSHGIGVPYPVLFKDGDGISFAGMRSAMLEAWRVFTFRRTHIGQGPSQKVWRMLQEEAFLRDHYPVPGGAARFYRDMEALTSCEWYGAPKGDIEPYSAIKADILANENNIKPLERIILETGAGNPAAVIRRIETEKKDLISRGIRNPNMQSTADREIPSPPPAAEES